MEFWLPVTAKEKLVRQVLVQKERGFIQVVCDLGEWWTSVLKSIFSARTRQKPVSRVPAPIESTVLWSLLNSHSPHPGTLACSWLLFISGSLLQWGRARRPMCHVADRLSWPHVPRWKSTKALASSSLGRQDIPRKAPCWRLWAAWLLRPHGPRREEASTPCESRSWAIQPLARERAFFFPPGLY